MARRNIVPETLWMAVRADECDLYNTGGALTQREARAVAAGFTRHGERWKAVAFRRVRRTTSASHKDSEKGE